jgi:uncharacterized membrane protein YhiD involved in acid resistance
MNELLQSLNGADRMRAELTVEGVLLALLLAFLLGQLVAWTYVRTHSGLSYSRSFTQSLVVMAVVVALLMTVIGDSIVTAFGLLGALALVRFRNVLKDTRDTVFILVSIVVGIAIGTERFVTGIVGCVVMLGIMWYLDVVSFGTLSRFDGYLTLRLAAREAPRLECEAVMRRYCRSSRQISKRQSGDGEDAEVVYQVGLRDRTRDDELMEALQKVGGVSSASVLLRDELSEV